MKTRFFLYLFSLVVYALQVSANDDNWDFNPYAYQYDMTAYVSLSIDGNSVNNYSGYEIAAFCGEECRGKAENKTVNGHEYLYLRVRSNKTEGEVISFMVRNLTTGRISKAAETLIFKSQGTVGYPSSPFLLSALSQYIATFIIDGESQSSMLSYGDAIVPPVVPEKKGYTFDGWVPEVETTMPDHDVTYTAVYVANQYTISFDTDGGSEIAPIIQDYNTAVTPPAEPTKVGHTFAGWDREIPLTMPAENVTIKALWTINKYTISFDTDGGSEIAPITQDYNSAVTPPADPTKVGHTFAGWDKEIPLTMPAENVTIKALWTVNRYTISFDTDGGNEIAPITQDYNSAVTPPADPTKVGHTFAGWDKEIPLTMPAENVTIKALWTVNKYKVSFIANDTIISEEMLAYGMRISPPEAPEKEGHTFAGWEDVPETMPAHDIEIYGTYTVNAYRLTVYLDDVIYMEEMLEYGAPIIIPVPEVPEGTKFDGWTTDIPETMPAYDLEIYGTTSVHTGIRGIIDVEQGECSVYDIKGHLLFKNISAKGIPNKLSKGLYIINGKKVLIR